jgi:hypothetical protein
MTTHPQRIMSLWDMLKDYFPIYQIALDLGALREDIRYPAENAATERKVRDYHSKPFKELLEKTQKRCAEHDLSITAELAEHLLSQPLPKNYPTMLADLNHLDRSLGSELRKESAFRIPPDRSLYYERKEPFGAEVAGPFPSCERDIRKAGDCYALGQEDACVHHLMMVLERGLHALADKVEVPYERTNWQKIIDQIEAKLKTKLEGKERAFYHEVNSEFGFLKHAYRNHSEHTHDELYDLDKALHIYNHVREFMRKLAKGKLSE